MIADPKSDPSKLVQHLIRMFGQDPLRFTSGQHEVDKQSELDPPTEFEVLPIAGN